MLHCKHFCIDWLQVHVIISSEQNVDHLRHSVLDRAASGSAWHQGGGGERDGGGGGSRGGGRGSTLDLDWTALLPHSVEARRRADGCTDGATERVGRQDYKKE